MQWVDAVRYSMDMQATIRLGDAAAKGMANAAVYTSVWSPRVSIQYLSAAVCHTYLNTTACDDEAVCELFTQVRSAFKW
jgi:hypothetical protein